MLILALSDIHANWRSYPVDDFPDADLVVIAGDLTEHGVAVPREIADAQNWLEELAERYPKVLWIPGNHDRGIADDGRITSGTNILNKTIHIPEGTGSPLAIHGICLCPAYDLPSLVNKFVYTTIDCNEERLAYTFESVDCVLSHCPPYGILDMWTSVPPGESPRHIGARALTDYVRQHAPKLVICGHVHDNPGYARSYDSHVYNVAMMPTLIDSQRPAWHRTIRRRC